MRFLLLLILAIFSFSAFAQSYDFKIRGRVIAGGDSISLESATVYAERVKDSSLITYTISDKEGRFELMDKSYEKMINLSIAYVGYMPYQTQVDVTQGEVDLSTVELKLGNSLDEIIIKSRAPITIKKDTLEFNVKSFKTKKDANVEDLLKKLPGVEVDENGSITVNGKPVNKILVNGKPFFGDDPTITTRNLTKEIIEKVQITDTKTKSEAFSGEEGDKENKTINLTIKEENNKGTFGRLAAGAGTDDLYEYAGIVNLFDNDQRISFLAGGNNLNSPGFSFGEIQKMFGRGSSSFFSSDGSFSIDGRSFGGGQGITTSNNMGANYDDVLTEEIELGGNYFYASSNSENQTRTERETILPDSRFFTESSSSNSGSTDDHSGEMQFDIELDSTFLINVEPRFRFSHSKNAFNSAEQSFNDNNDLTNSSNLSSFVEETGRNFSSNFNITKKFGNRGAFIKVSLDTELNQSESDDFLDSELVFIDEANNVTRNQFTDNQEDLNSINASMTYRLPLSANKWFLDFKYGMREDKRTNLRQTFDFNQNTQEFTDFNFDLSTDFTYNNSRSTPGLELVHRGEKLSVTLGGGYVFRTLKNSDDLRPELNLEEDFKAIELRSWFSYRFSDRSSIYFNYALDNQPPELRQIRPFTDVSDPLNIITGNPDLDPTNAHRVYLSYNNYDFQKKTGFNIYANGSLTNDRIVPRTNVDPETLVRQTTYANVDDNYRASFGGSISKSIKIDTLQSVRIRTGVWSNYNRNVNFFNNVQYASSFLSVTPNLRATYTYKDVMEITPNYRISITKSNYDIANFDEQDFVSHSIGINTATFVPKNLEWRNDIDFNYNPNVARGFQKSAWFWNSTLAYTFYKEKLTMTLKVYDLLNQNNNARRTATANYIQDTESTVLQQYFLLSLSYKFNSLGKKGETSNNSFHMF